MVFFYRTPQAIIISTLCSIAIAAFIYFVIVKPQTDDANNQVNHALKQAQPQIDAANKQLKDAQPQINAANKKLACIQAAAGDVNKIAACN
jgi:peptidoglycan hydrolase CwlO-like protein